VNRRESRNGTWLTELRPSGNAGHKVAPLTIRVIDYQLDDGRLKDTTYRLFTTLLDPAEAPAVDLAVAYAQRWEIESTFDELKTHQRGARTVLRSKSPELVLQEIWGHLCCHYAIRTLMWQAVDHAKVNPDRVSFVSALRIARRSISAARDFPPQPEHGWRHANTLICQRLNPARRSRSNPRLIKRKYVKWHVKRARHANWP
jgi:hypothetical protein